MIGIGAAVIYIIGILIPASFVLVGVFLLLTNSAQIEGVTGVKGPANMRSARIIGAFFVLFPMFGLCFMSAKLLNQIRFHTQLSSLQPTQVVEIQTPNGVISSRPNIERITAAIRDSQWFLLNGGLRTTIAAPLTVRLKSKQYLSFSVVYQLQQQTALIFADDSDSIEFSANLAKALNATGLTLPIPEADRPIKNQN